MYKMKHISLCGLVLSVIASAALFWTVAVPARSLADETPGLGNLAGKKCYHTKYVGNCGNTGQGPTVTCSEGVSCLTWMSWTQGFLKECEQSGTVAGFDGCAVGAPCIYHYRSWECEDGACVVNVVHDESIDTTKAAGGLCAPSEVDTGEIG